MAPAHTHTELVRLSALFMFDVTWNIGGRRAQGRTVANAAIWLAGAERGANMQDFQPRYHTNCQFFAVRGVRRGEGRILLG